MTTDEIAVLRRAHNLFAGNPTVPSGAGAAGEAERALPGSDTPSGSAFARYRHTAAQARTDLRDTAATDAALLSVARGAADHHAAARQRTRVILDAAETDPMPAADTPMGQREALRRRVARLRAGHRTVSLAQLDARRRLALIRALRYRLAHGASLDLARLPEAPNRRAALAVRAALSRIGCPYVWAAAGPHSFDCSGLMQWAYRQVGLDLAHSTYVQIHQGVPVPRSMAAPGDLVFPEPGHVQMYIGNGEVVEAPHTGANVRIAPMGHNVQIRRPVL